MITSGPDIYEPENLLSPLRSEISRLAACLTVLFFAALTSPAFAHDPYVINARANLQSNRLELRITLAGVTVESLLAVDDERMSTADALSDVEKSRPQLKRCAAGLFEVLAGNRRMAASETNVMLTAQDHVEFVMTYPRPAEGKLRFDAVALNKLPDNEPYGVVLTFTDSEGHRLLGQKLLTVKDSAFSVERLTFANISTQSVEVKSPAAPPLNH